MHSGIKNSEGMRVLLIEGNAHVRAPLEHVLKTRGHNVTALQSGERGVEAIADSGHDAVICNYHLPGMNGIDFFSKSRRILRRATTILTATFVDDFLANNALAMGITVFMEMPFKIDNLIACVEGRTPNLGVGPLGGHLYVTSSGQMMAISPSPFEDHAAKDLRRKSPLPKTILRSGRRWKLYQNPDAPQGALTRPPSVLAGNRDPGRSKDRKYPL